MEFEWKNFQGFITLQILAEMQKVMTAIQCDPEQFPGRIIFKPMYNDIVWRVNGNEDVCIANSQNAAEYARKFAHRHWSFLWPGSEKRWYGTHTYKPNGNGILSLRKCRSTSVQVDIHCSLDPVLWNEELCEANEKEHCLHISVVTTTQPNWFFAQSIPSISSVFTEQQRTCATNWPVESLVVQKIQRNL